MNRKVVVLGAGVGGLASALLLARDGHQVSVIERDDFLTGAAQDSPVWPRKGVAHFLQPHAFMPRGRRELQEHFHDVLDDLLDAGAFDLDMCQKLPGAVTDADQDLRYLAVRRPLIEWAFRRAVTKESSITVHPRETVSALLVEGGVVRGVKTDRNDFAADLVIDAQGRRSKCDSWLTEAGMVAPTTESNECGVLYFSRYYKLRQGCDLPDGPWLLGPRGDLGYMAYNSFPGDNGTFAALLAVPPGQATSRLFKDDLSFETAVSTIPALSQWVNPQCVDPITDVMMMAGLRNSIISSDSVRVRGLVAVGDASFHTDPVMALGLSFALVQAVALSHSVNEYQSLDDAMDDFARETGPLMRERFEFSSALDEQRLRMWTGESVNFHSPRGDYELFSLVAGGVAALMDPEIFRVVMRRMGLLESNAILDENQVMQQRIEEIFAKASQVARPAPGPSLEEMVAIVERASVPSAR